MCFAATRLFCFTSGRGEYLVEYAFPSNAYMYLLHVYILMLYGSSKRGYSEDSKRTQEENEAD
jgi:hypothetical protein